MKYADKSKGLFGNRLYPAQPKKYYKVVQDSIPLLHKEIVNMWQYASL